MRCYDFSQSSSHPPTSQNGKAKRNWGRFYFLFFNSYHDEISRINVFIRIVFTIHEHHKKAHSLFEWCTGEIFYL